MSLTISDSTLNLTLSLLLSYLEGYGPGYAFLPTQAEASCVANITLTSLVFYGDSDIVDTLNAKEAELCTTIGAALSNESCTIIQELVSVNITQALLSLSGSIANYTAPLPEPLAIPLVPIGSDDLMESALFNAADYFVDEVIGENGLNLIVNTITNDTGNIFFLTNSPAQGLSLGSLGNLSISVTSVAIQGLNSWSIFDLIEPVSRYSVKSDAAIDIITLNITFSTNFSTNSNGSGVLYDPLWIYEEWFIAFNVQKGDFFSLLQFSLDIDLAENFTDTQYRNISCLTSLFHWNSTALTNLTLLIDNATLISKATNGAAESDIQSAINNLLTLVLDSYSLSFPALVYGLGNSALAITINEMISNTFGTMASTCPYMADETPACDVIDQTVLIGSAVLAFGIFLVILAVWGIITLWRKKHMKINREEEPLFSDISMNKKPSIFTDQICLIMHPIIPLWLRITVPFLLCCIAGAFIFYKFTHDIAMEISISTGTGRDVRFPPMYNSENVFLVVALVLNLFFIGYLD